MGLGRNQRHGYHDQLEHDKQLDRNLAKYAAATSVPHRREQRTCDPIELEHDTEVEPGEQVGHNQQLGDHRDFILDGQITHDTQGQKHIAELQEIIVGSLYLAFLPPFCLVCLSAIVHNLLTRPHAE